MKRLIILSLAILLSACFSIPVCAEQANFSIAAESVSAAPGGTVQVKFSFENNPGISLFTLSLAYDKEALTLKEINGNRLMGGTFNVNIEDGFILWMSSNGDSCYDGVVFTAVFTVKKETTVNSSAVSVSMPDGDSSILNDAGESIAIAINPGCVNINTIGDIKRDGEINLFDLVELKKSLLDPSLANDSCDTNGDGIINILDFIRLKRYIAGVDVVLGSTEIAAS